MLKGIFSKASLALSLFLFSFIAQAALTHISINSRQFELGQHPKIKLNIVASSKDLSRLSIHLRQTNDDKESMEELMVQPISSFMLFAIGVEDVSDPKAKLIVSEYKGNSWRQFAVLPVFDSPFIKETAKTQIKIDKQKQLPKVVTQAVPKLASSSQSVAEKPSTSRPSTTAKVLNNKPTPTMGHCYIERQASDTLWRIATRYQSEWDLNVYGVMMAIFDANPQGFSKQKIHLIRQDVTLACPSQEQLNQYGNKAQDKLRFEALQQQHRQ